MPVGALHTKHVRYLLPLLPFCCLLTANALLKSPEHLPIKSRAQGRRFVHIAVDVLVLTTVLHGLAFARVYTEQDSRLQASRWIQENIPAGSTIAVERVGFSMRGLINWQRYTYRSLDTSSLFGTRGYCSCQASYEFFKGRLEPVQYIVLLPVNRARQYAAAPEVLPAMTAFYQRLAAGQLGFERVARFKVEPGLASLRFNDDHAEPSFLGYDHPTVWIFKRTDGFASDWENWRHALTTTPHCDDQAFKEFADLINAGQLDQALGKIQSLEPTHSLKPLAALVEAYIYQRQKQSGQSQVALADYVAGYQNIALANHLLPWASSLSLVGIGLDHLVLNALADGAGRCHSFHRAHYGTMVASYQEMADRFNDRDQPSFARQALQLANQIRPQANTYGALAELARRADDHDEAWALWQQSLKLDSTQANVHQHLGRTALRQRHNYPLALEHLTRALELDSTRADSLKPLIAEARLLTNGKAP
jgi:tetratricopeptide (TPR) repeat protein